MFATCKIVVSIINLINNLKIVFGAYVCLSNNNYGAFTMGSFFFLAEDKVVSKGGGIMDPVGNILVSLLSFVVAIVSAVEI